MEEKNGGESKRKFREAVGDLKKYFRVRKVGLKKQEMRRKTKRGPHDLLDTRRSSCFATTGLYVKHNFYDIVITGKTGNL